MKPTLIAALLAGTVLTAPAHAAHLIEEPEPRVTAAEGVDMAQRETVYDYFFSDRDRPGGRYKSEGSDRPRPGREDDEEEDEEGAGGGDDEDRRGGGRDEDERGSDRDERDDDDDDDDDDGDDDDDDD